MSPTDEDLPEKNNYRVKPGSAKREDSPGKETTVVGRTTKGRAPPKSEFDKEVAKAPRGEKGFAQLQKGVARLKAKDEKTAAKAAKAQEKAGKKAAKENEKRGKGVAKAIQSAGKGLSHIKAPKISQHKANVHVTKAPTLMKYAHKRKRGQ